MKYSIAVFCALSILLGIQTLFAVIEVEDVNTTTVGLYEKFEVRINLSNSHYSNPYDPEEIDVKAVFTSPTGEEWKVFGFYDDYQSANQWKVHPCLQTLQTCKQRIRHG